MDLRIFRHLNVLLWDIETSPIIYTGFSLYPDAISHKNILQDWYIYTIAWRRLGYNKTYSLPIHHDPNFVPSGPSLGGSPPVKDRWVVAEMHKVLSEADVIIAHNGDRFDLRKFNARCISLGLPSLPMVQTIDTLKQARLNFMMTSNRLDALARALGVTPKRSTPEGLWQKCLFDDVPSLKKMDHYCRGDVGTLEEVFVKMLPYMRGLPNFNLLLSGETDLYLRCPHCFSKKVHQRGFRTTNTRIYRRYQCQSCTKWSRANTSNPDTEKVILLS